MRRVRIHEDWVCPGGCWSFDLVLFAGGSSGTQHASFSVVSVSESHEDEEFAGSVVVGADDAEDDEENCTADTSGISDVKVVSGCGPAPGT